MQITVVGAGYVGLSLATLLGQKHEVIVLDIDEEKVAKVNSRISPVQDVYLEKFFAERKLNLTATVDTAIAYKDAEYVIITTPIESARQYKFTDCELILDTFIENARDYICAK